LERFADGIGEYSTTALEFRRFEERNIVVIWKDN
jgi:hypothetical protein